MNKDIGYYAALIVALIIALIVLWTVFDTYQDCKKSGGVAVRGIIGYQCLYGLGEK